MDYNLFLKIFGFALAVLSFAFNYRKNLKSLEKIVLDKILPKDKTRRYLYGTLCAEIAMKLNKIFTSILADGSMSVDERVHLQTVINSLDLALSKIDRSS